MAWVRPAASPPAGQRIRNWEQMVLLQSEWLDGIGAGIFTVPLQPLPVRAKVPMKIG